MEVVYPDWSNKDVCENGFRYNVKEADSFVGLTTYLHKRYGAKDHRTEDTCEVISNLAEMIGVAGREIIIIEGDMDLIAHEPTFSDVRQYKHVVLVLPDGIGADCVMGADQTLGKYILDVRDKNRLGTKDGLTLLANDAVIENCQSELERNGYLFVPDWKDSKSDYRMALEGAFGGVFELKPGIDEKHFDIFYTRCATYPGYLRKSNIMEPGPINRPVPV